MRRRFSREVVGYCLFDFANSSYTTLISTVAFSVYFRQVVVGMEERGDLLWSLAQVSAHVLLILTSPIFGALADYSGRKKRFLLLTTIQTVVATSLLVTVGPGDVALAIVLLIIGTLGFEGGYVFYNAFLPEVSTPRTIGRVSGWSWGTGFLGGLLALVACAPLIGRPLTDPTGAVDAGAAETYRLAFVVVAVFFALFSVPTFLFLRERPSGHPHRGLRQTAAIGFRRVGQTLRRLRDYRDTARFVLAALFFYGGIDTVIKFSAIYATVTFGIEGGQLVLLFIISNLIAAPGTLIAGHVADWLGGKRALLLTLAGWIVLLAFGAVVRSNLGFWMMASGIAVGMGSTQAIARSFMSQLSPPSRSAEFFGFYMICNKIGSILSLLTFGVIAGWTGNQRLAVVSIAPFFAVGLLLLSSVDVARATASRSRAEELDL